MVFFNRLLLFSTFLTLCVVVFGAYVRLTDAGLGCPDWPDTGMGDDIAAPRICMVPVGQVQSQDDNPSRLRFFAKLDDIPAMHLCINPMPAEHREKNHLYACLSDLLVAELVNKATRKNIPKAKTACDTECKKFIKKAHLGRPYRHGVAGDHRQIFEFI